MQALSGTVAFVTSQLARFAFGQEKTLKDVLQNPIYTPDDLIAFAMETEKLSIYELAVLVYLLFKAYLRL